MKGGEGRGGRFWVVYMYTCSIEIAEIAVLEAESKKQTKFTEHLHNKFPPSLLLPRGSRGLYGVERFCISAQLRCTYSTCQYDRYGVLIT